jgi:hypothetical protein
MARATIILFAIVEGLWMGFDGTRALTVGDYHTGRPQRYGSQFSVQNGRLIPDSIEDLPGLEAHRTAVGLPSMAEYVRMLGQMYGLPITWPPTP